MAGWNDLPFELRSMIVDYIRENAAWPWPSNRSPYPGLPLVCREWQDFFPHQNFGIILLDQDRLDEFERLVSNNDSRREYVHQILVHIRLPEYDCTVCQMEEDEDTARENDYIVVQTLLKLFAILSTWDEEAELELEIGVCSPSDRKHAVRDEDIRHSNATSDQRRTDVCPGWKRTCEGKGLLMGTKSRLLATIADPLSTHYHSLPFSLEGGVGFSSVPAVNALSIRRHFHRSFSPALLVRIIEALPNLRRFRHEPWPQPDLPSQANFEFEYSAVVQALPEETLIVELLPQSDTNFPQLHWNASLCVGNPYVRRSQYNLKSAIFRRAQSLHVLNVSSPAISQGLISDISVRSTPCHLRYLGLAIDMDMESSRMLSCLIRMARVAYQHMPQLQSMVVHGSNKDDGFFMIFTYTDVEDALRRPSILWGRAGDNNAKMSGFFKHLRSDLAISHPGKTPLVEERAPSEDATLVVPYPKELSRF